jgi:hypothetical protein
LLKIVAKHERRRRCTRRKPEGTVDILMHAGERK